FLVADDVGAARIDATPDVGAERREYAGGFPHTRLRHPFVDVASRQQYWESIERRGRRRQSPGRSRRTDQATREHHDGSAAAGAAQYVLGGEAGPLREPDDHNPGR